MLTDSQLQQIMPTLSASKRDQYLPFLNLIMPMYGIDSNLREAAFLAQIAHESGELKFWEEIWGPTSAQKRYEPPSDLAARLGNTQAGDGKRYKGRGPIQITGRSNYRKYGGLLGVDLESNPDMASTTQTGLQVAGQFWKSNGLNELADIPDFTKITTRINGGQNGAASRQKYYERAKQVLGVGTSFGTFRAAAFAADDAETTDSLPPATLPRGQEAIEEILGSSSSGGSAKPAAKKKSAKKPARKVSKPVAVKKAAKKAAKKTAKPAKKAAKPVAKKAAKKAVKPVAKKAAPKAAKKAVKKAPATATKPTKKAAKKPVKKAAGKSAKKKA